MSAALEEAKILLERAIPLFKDEAPGSEGYNLTEELYEETRRDGSTMILIQNTIKPRMIPMIPEHCNGTAVIVIPGGSFRRQGLYGEGIDVAEWLNKHGYAAFVLFTRYPYNAHKVPADVPLIDTQRAIRIVRSRAEEFGILPDRVGVMGFSAGGHAAACAAVAYDTEPYPFEDEFKHISARPDFIALCYPAISEDGFGMKLEEVPPQMKYQAEVLTKYSVEKMVHDKMPPVFIFETDDDKTTPAENSILFYMAARKAGVPAELHIFKQGGHGFGMAEKGKPVNMWTELFLKWIESVIAN